MKIRVIIFELFIIGSWSLCNGQIGQGFFLDSWHQKSISSPTYVDVQQTTDPVNVALTIDFHDTLTKIPVYLFGDNANVYTGCMADNKSLMKNIADRNIGVLRGPSGSISDVFFWNRNVNEPPDDVPASMLSSLWYGDRPYSWETWTMAVDSFYSILGKVNATGMLTVNYGYARYGTSIDPVASAAHLAANWVRYDKGRTKFWEIGNEVYGSWEAGYRIDPSLNKDGQSEYITGTLYGKHCLVFIDSMRAAARETGAEIKIGLVMTEEYSSSAPSWNSDVAAQAGDNADFYVVHSYYTPYNENSTVETILSSYQKTDTYINYVWGELDKVGKPHLPVALTEYNIFAVGSNQPVSHVNGMHAVLVTGEAMKAGFGAALRWDLANGWSDGNDQGMFSSGSEPGVPLYAPRPAFFHLYYLQKYSGDVLLNSSLIGSSDVTLIPTAFNSGQVGVAIVNQAKSQKVIRINIKNFKFGDRYYTYTITGNPDVDFSRKIFINGIGNSLDAGGPTDYENIKANSSVINNEICIRIPPLSVTFVLVEAGTKELTINNQVTSEDEPWYKENIGIYPNPAHGSFTVTNMPSGITFIEIKDVFGRLVYSETVNNINSEQLFNIKLIPGVYFISFTNNNHRITKKFITS
jgi:Secretion system C-terminal sorting domain